MWPFTLSGRLPIKALVGRYPTNKLMRRGLIFEYLLKSEAGFYHIAYVMWSYPALAPVSRGYPSLKGKLPTRYSPVRHFTHSPKETFSFDLHVLGTPLAFVLSQDQTLQLN